MKVVLSISFQLPLSGTAPIIEEVYVVSQQLILLLVYQGFPIHPSHCAQQSSPYSQEPSSRCQVETLLPAVEGPLGVGHTFEIISQFTFKLADVERLL